MYPRVLSTSGSPEEYWPQYFLRAGTPPGPVATTPDWNLGRNGEDKATQK